MNHPDSFYLIENTAQEFWALAGGKGEFPCDMRAAIILALPLEVYPIPALRVAHILDWTRRVKIAHRIGGRDRRLHGCLLADRSKGTIFVDASDASEEQRFTLAHELAHFLLDYQQPRQRALNALGPSILPVLDGQRAPNIEERVHAVMSNVSLGAMSHFMERPESGLPTDLVIDIENRADRLALELLAPAGSLYALMQQAMAPKGFDARLVYLAQTLMRGYGLPEAIASSYGRYVLAELGEPTLRDWLFGVS
ncbi:MAG: ImmA/IrrE family metallo-endopeptidase [Ktedonobacteraceae bacterium]